MVDTAPFSPDVAAISKAGNYAVSFHVLPVVFPNGSIINVTTIDLSIEYNLRRTPYVTARATLGWPMAGKLKYFDPDAFDLRISVLVGYKRLSTGIEESNAIALLRVTRATLDYTAQTIELEASSDDYLLGSQVSLLERPYTTADTYGHAIQQLVGDALPGETLSWVGSATKKFERDDVVLIGEDIWDAVQEYADVARVEVRHDGLSTWRLDRPVSVPSGASDAILNVGPTGNVTRAVVEHDRSQSLTDVVVVWTYVIDQDDPDPVTGEAGTTAIGFAVASTGRTPRSMFVSERKRRPGDPAGVASKLLARGLRRGHQWNIEGLPMFWLRPADTVSINLSRASHARALVEVVSFDLGSATMRLTAQTPVIRHEKIVASASSSHYFPHLPSS